MGEKCVLIVEHDEHAWWMARGTSGSAVGAPWERGREREKRQGKRGADPEYNKQNVKVFYSRINFILPVGVPHRVNNQHSISFHLTHRIQFHPAPMIQFYLTHRI